jgi:phosphoribosyl 1,2-cyclic phosphate phosphodiesterase
MILTFLGTAAANACPLAFCRCQNCERARRIGGANLRRRSAVLINDDLLIDLGPDIITGAFHCGRALTNISYCLQTHSHPDHFDPSHFEPRTPGPGWEVVGAPRLHFYASPATLRQVVEHTKAYYGVGDLFDPAISARQNIELHEIAALQPFLTGAYRVIAFPANHDQSIQSLLYAVAEKDGCIFYGTDTGALSETTWQAFHQHQLRFDVVVLDHTYGPGALGAADPGDDHLCAEHFIAHFQRMRDEDLLAPKARIFATHLSHEGNPSHDELSAFAAQHGYEIAYDGLTVQIGS